jgi:hypothetical protein
VDVSDLAVKTVKTERLAPDPKGTAQALQRIGYSLDEALADLVDNSIDAGASNVRIRFLRTNSSITQVAVVDDGKGMDEATLHRAMQYGVQMEHRPSDLGKYGIGLKTASFSQCQSVSVFSKQSGKVNGRRWTLTRMQDDWRCEILDAAQSARLFDMNWGDVSLDQHGTVVVWDELDALSAGVNDIDKLIRKITKRLPVELGLRFHRFIAYEQVVLKVDFCNLNGGDVVPVTIPAVDPFAYDGSGRTGYPLNYKLELSGRGTLSMAAHIWPAKSAKFEYKLGGGRVAERQGFYFYRNDRLIQGGGWNGVRESDSEPHSSLARVQIDLPAKLDAAFGLTIQKSKVVPPPDFKSLVIGAKAGNTTFEDYISAAVETYRDNSDEESPQMIVPGWGLPVPLQRKLAQVLGATNGEAREIRFEWKDLESHQLFDSDGANDVVYLNLEYRPVLVEKGAHNSSDVPLLKALLFLLLSPDLRKERRSQKRDEWHILCNKVLTTAIRTMK